VAIDAAYLGGLRTGATLAVAIKHLAAAEAHSVGLIGTGRLAPQLIEGMRTVRPDLEDVTAYSRDRQQLLAFCDSRRVRPANDVAECFTKDVVIVATTSRLPIIDDAEVPVGALVCGVGANWRDEREVGEGIIRRMDRLVCDYLPQARLEAADLIEPVEKGLRSWSDVVQLGDVITGVAPGRLDRHDRIFFKSLGIGLEDLAVLQALTAIIDREERES
jgi:ornithine cyclodeaminase